VINLENSARFLRSGLIGGTHSKKKPASRDKDSKTSAHDHNFLRSPTR
jgi:hypothetical protein